MRTSTHRAPISTRRRWLFRAILLGFLLLLAEVGGFVSLRILNRRLPMDPMAEITPERVESFLRRRYDPVCGWGPNDVLGDIDALGARRRKAFRGDFGSTVSVYGDSYTFGLNVPVEYCWPMQLEGMVHLPILNFAVDGFGTDQALLRLEQLYEQVPSATVLLCIQVENINRCVSIYRGFYQAGFSPPKPVFVVDQAGGVEPFNPFDTAERVEQLLLDDPERLWKLAREHDYWYRQIEFFGRPWWIGFPYSVQAARRLPYVARRSLLAWRNEPLHAALYRDPHALAVMRGLIDRFRGLADRERFHGLVVVLPTIRDCRVYRRDGVLPYQPLLEMLDTAGVAYVDVAPALAAESELESLYIDGESHYTAAGGRVVAQAVRDFLLDERALPPPPLDASR